MDVIGQYQIIKIGKGSPGDAGLLEPDLIQLIEELLQKGVKHMVLVFEEPPSRSHSKQISLLLQYIRKIVATGGKVAAIIPDENLYELLIEMGVPDLISIFRSEEEMRTKIADNG